MSRSVKVIKEDIRPIVEEASKAINYRTLFECPFPTTCELTEWITDAWRKTLEDDDREYERCNEVCRREVHKPHSPS